MYCNTSCLDFLTQHARDTVPLNAYCDIVGYLHSVHMGKTLSSVRHLAKIIQRSRCKCASASNIHPYFESARCGAFFPFKIAMHRNFFPCDMSVESSLESHTVCFCFYFLITRFFGQLYYFLLEAQGLGHFSPFKIAMRRYFFSCDMTVESSLESHMF